MLHPHTRLAFVNDAIGLGVFATELIPAGTITWALDPLDRRVTATELEALSPSLQRTLERYGYLDADGTYILCWDFARFINHSCDPNTLSPGIDIEIAVRDIHPGEQLTGDYGAYNLEADFTCHCGASTCRGTIRNDDFDTFADDWDLALRKACERVRHVNQPLMDFVSDASVLAAAAVNPTLLPTCRSHRLAERRVTAHGN